MLELEHEFRVRDCHARLTPHPEEDADDGDAEPRIGAEALERELRQAGIVRAIVFPSSGEDRLRANNAVARASTDRPFVPFARVGGPRPRSHRGGSTLRDVVAHATPGESASGIERYATDDRFAGFVVDPARDGLPAPEALERMTVTERPLLVLCGERYPPDAATELLAFDLPVILAHFGGHPLQRDLMRDAIALLDDHERCYLDTSYVRYRDLIARALREHPDRVLFGSGTPATHPSVAVAELLSVDIPEDGLRKAFERNPARIVDGL